MPVDCEILDDLRLVIAKASGHLIGSEIAAYQRNIWTGAKIFGYDEIFDLTEVQTFDYKSVSDVRELAQLASSMDWASRSRKLALVANTDMAFGLARMYQAYRESDPSSRTEVQVFRNHDLARQWLGR